MNKNGIGLGLVIANKLVNEFEGQMSFESIAGKGSEFWFSFKLFDEHEAVQNNENLPNMSEIK